MGDHVLLLCDDWGSGNGGLSTANRMMAEAFSDDACAGTCVSVMLPDTPDVRGAVKKWKEREGAAAAGRISFLFHKALCRLSTADGTSSLFKVALSGVCVATAGAFSLLMSAMMLCFLIAARYSASFFRMAPESAVDTIAEELAASVPADVSVVLGHALVTGLVASHLAQLCGAAYWHMVHVLPDRLDQAKRRLNEEKRERERAVIAGKHGVAARVVLGFGPLLEREWRAYVGGARLVRIDPWLLKSTNEQAVAEGKKGVLLVGRMEHMDQKGVVPVMAAFTRCGEELWRNAGEPAFFVRGLADYGEAEKMIAALNEDTRTDPTFPKSFFNAKRLTDDATIVAENYALAEVVVMPSITEAYGLVANEAVAARRPVLVGDDSGFALLLREAPEMHRFAGQLVVTTSIGEAETVKNWESKLRAFMKWRGAGVPTAASETWPQWGDELHNVFDAAFTRAHAARVLLAALQGDEVLPPRPILRGRELYGRLPVLAVGLPHCRVFVGRSAQFNKVLASLRDANVSALVQGMVGLGGVGKTALALHVAHRVLAEHRFDLIVWADASTMSALHESLATVARQHGGELGIAEGGTARESARAVVRWMECTDMRWLLVLDNADGTALDSSLDTWAKEEGVEDEVVAALRRYGAETLAQVAKLTEDRIAKRLGLNGLQEDDLWEAVQALQRARALGKRASLEEIAALLPKKTAPAGFGRVLVTSRRSDGEIAVLRSDVHVTELGTLSDDDAVNMASKLSRLEEDDKAMRRVVVEKLGGLALAVELAAAAVRESARMTWALLEEQFGHDGADALDEGAVRVTWDACFDALREELGDAFARCEAMAHMVSVLAPAPVPLRLLASDDDDVAALRQLHRLSLVQWDDAAGTVEMHRLLQAVIRERMSAEERGTVCVEAVNALDAAWPADDLPERRRRALSLLPHVLHIVGDKDGTHSDTCVARLQRHGAQGLLESGDIRRAMVMAQNAVDVLEAGESAESDALLTAQHTLARVLHENSELEKAERLYRCVLEKRLRVLGKDHRDTVATRNNLATVLRDQSDLAGAVREFGEILAVLDQSDILGREHPDTLSVRNNLAQVLVDLKQFAEAEELFREVLSIQKKPDVLGHDHASTLNTRHNLAGVLRDREIPDLQGAEEMFRDVLHRRQILLGASHPKALETLHNLAVTLWYQKDIVAAEKMFHEVFDARVRVLGAEHVDTLTSEVLLATMLRDRDQLVDAKRMYRHVWGARGHNLGMAHPDTLTTLYGLADICIRMHHYDEAVTFAEMLMQAGVTTADLTEDKMRTLLEYARVKFHLAQ